MTAYLVRHAKAGDRADWAGDDRLRPLSRPGERQAEGLVGILQEAQIHSVFSSPYLRCVQTVEPVARRFGLRVEHERSLAEGAGADGIAQLVRLAAGRNIVLCSHGDVIEEFLEHLVQRGLVARSRARLDKASTWALDENKGRIVAAKYLPAPD
ncbi:MAG: hypothetical protein PVSMB9_06060 [Candidatus Dormibacteria bacterium]